MECNLFLIPFFCSSERSSAEVISAITSPLFSELIFTNFDIIEDGDYVVCAVSGKNIPIKQLTYWNVDLQEAYFSPKEAQQRYEELNKK